MPDAEQRRDGGDRRTEFMAAPYIHRPIGSLRRGGASSKSETRRPAGQVLGAGPACLEGIAGQGAGVAVFADLDVVGAGGEGSAKTQEKAASTPLSFRRNTNVRPLRN